MGQNLNDAITGKTNNITRENGVYNAITGKRIAYLEGNKIYSSITGKPKYIIDGDLPSGGGGVDVSATTATASDVKQGKKFYTADGALTSGTNTDVNVTATTATAPDVLKGKQFYNAQGVLTQGTLVPQAGGGTMDFFKCAAVAGGEEEPLPEPVFHAPLSSQSDTALTGQTLNVSGEVSYTNFNGVDCVLIPDQYNYIYFSDDGFPSGDSDRTICCRMCTEGDYTAPFPFCGYGDSNQQSNFYMSLREGTFGFDTNFVGEKTSQTFDTTVWNFYAVRVKDGQVTAIVNDYKEELSHDSFYTELNGSFQIGRWCDHTAFGGRMYICDVQVYNTALSDDQLMKLYDPSYEPEAPLPPNTWNGYKAVLVTDTDGKQYYEFEETLTEGLTFGNGFTPVVDKVYDTEAMITAVLTEKIKYPEIASPIDMTSYTKDDWVVSESDYRFDSTRGYKAFYPNGIWAGYEWLQWQNTAQQVLIRQLTFGYGGNSNWIYSCRLDGSDDGEHWTEIGTRDCEYDSDNDTILTFPDNNTAYYYHRLVVLSSNGCAVVYKLLAKREIDGKNTP